MKTAISLPDPLFHEAERLAQQLKISRSQLYANALREFLRDHRQELIRDSLDRVYGEMESGLPADLKTQQRKVITKGDW